MRSARSTSSRRCTVRSVIRRTFSINPSRSIAGIAHSSPIASAATSGSAATRSTLSWSMRPSVCEMSVIAISYTRGYPGEVRGELGEFAIVAAPASSRALPEYAPARRDSCRGAIRLQGRRRAPGRRQTTAARAPRAGRRAYPPDGRAGAPASAECDAAKLVASYRARARSEVIRTQQVTANRSRQEFVGRFGA